jgi:branched-chain amino acid transport system substrate-binding protein
MGTSDWANGSWCNLSGRALRVALGAAACAAIGFVASSCSLLVATSADQCAAVADCATLPGLRQCSADKVCEAVATPPACADDAACEGYAAAVCTGGVCVRSSCAADTDCGSDGVTCEAGACVPGVISGGCKVNADCKTKGPYNVCRKGACVSLVNDLCTTIHSTKDKDADAYLDDTALVIGSILPTNGGADAPYGKLVEDAIKLALDDFRKVDGIPGLSAGTNRPIVLVGCNDGVEENQTDAAAKHLAEVLEVPAIIGYAFSGNTIQVANDVTIKDGVLLISPSATSAQITNLNDNDLVWRTSPSDNVQAQALTLYYGDVEAALKKKYPGVDPAHIKVAIVNHDDAYGAGLGDSLEAQLTFNGKSATDPANDGCAVSTGPDGTKCYKRVDYGKSTSPDLAKLTDIVNFAPDVIFVFGFNEGVDQIFPGVEKAWTVPADGHRPFWVFSDGGQVASLWATHADPANPSESLPADIATEDQRTRVSGTVPGVNASSWPAYGTFLSEFTSSTYAGAGSPDTIGPAGAYDILYLLAYSAVMTGDKPVTGANLVKYGLREMKKDAGLEQVDIDRNKILSAFPLLSSGKAVNVTGKSGPLPFDAHGDLTTADIQIWCVPAATSGPDVGSAAISSGRYFDSKSSVMAGTIGAGCGL